MINTRLLLVPQRLGLGFLLLFACISGCQPMATVEDGPVLRRSGSENDLFILGDGFFMAKNPDGVLCLTKGGQLGVDQNLQLTITTNGSTMVLSPPVQIPFDAKSVSVKANGEVWANLKSSPHEYQIYGQLVCGLVAEAMFSPMRGEWKIPTSTPEEVFFGTDYECFVVAGWKLSQFNSQSITRVVKTGR